jgi:CRP/FNR family transcriptional regulator, cyclic AMP receptor protein
VPAPLTPADLQALPLFAQISAPQAEALLAGQFTVVVAAEQVLLLDQDEGEGLLVILEGLAKVRAYSADGEEAVMAVLGPGDLMGEMAVLTQGVRNADVLALTPMVAVKLRAGAYRDLLLGDGRFALALARLLAARLATLNRRFLLRGSDATTRLLAVLLDLAHTCSRGQDPLALIPPLPQRELAAMAGLSRETTSRTFAQLRQRGMVIGDPQGMRIADLQPLRKRGLLA